MRIAYLADPGTANGFYRCIGPMTAVGHCFGHEVRALATEMQRPPLADVRDVDVLFVHRYVDERVELLMRAAKANGAAVVWDNDDDFTALPKNSASHRRIGSAGWERRLAATRRVMRLADLVTTTSGPLAARLHEHGATHVATIENHIPDQCLATELRPHDGVTIGWIAGLEHQIDVERIPIRETLQQLLDERGDVRVITLGLRLGLRGDRYQPAEGGIPVLRLAQHAAQYDIAIAPLADIPFNRARSNIKLKEYAAGGVAWLASPIGPYAGMGEKQGGRLVADDRWHAELARLVDKPRERRKLAKRAAAWVAGETLTKHAATWESKLGDAVRRARAA